MNVIATLVTAYPWGLGIAGVLITGVALCMIGISATRHNRGGDK